MIMFNRAAAIALLLATSLGSWAAGENATPNAWWEKVKAYTHEQKNEAVAEGKKVIAATDKKIAELSQQAKSASGQAKVEHEKNMQDLKAKKKEAQVHLEKLEKSSSKAWDATKEGFSNAYKDLDQAYTKAAAAVK